MGTLFDILLVGVVLITLLVNYFRGIFRILKSFKVMSAFLIALEMKGDAAVKRITAKFIDFDRFRSYLRERMGAMWGDQLDAAAEAEVEVEAERFDGIFGGFVEKLTDITEYCQKAFSSGAENFTNDVLNYAADAAESFFTQLIGFVVVFIVAFVALTVICWILTFILNHGIMKFINRLLGGVAGLVFGLVFAWVLSFLIVNFGPMLLPGDPQAVTGGFFGVVKWFYNEFPLSSLFGLSRIA